MRILLGGIGLIDEFGLVDKNLQDETDLHNSKKQEIIYKNPVLKKDEYKRYLGKTIGAIEYEVYPRQLLDLNNYLILKLKASKILIAKYILGSRDPFGTLKGMIPNEAKDILTYFDKNLRIPNEQDYKGLISLLKSNNELYDGLGNKVSDSERKKIYERTLTEEESMPEFIIGKDGKILQGNAGKINYWEKNEVAQEYDDTCVRACKDIK